MSSTSGAAVVTTRGDQLIVVTRELDAPKQLVWDAHHRPEYVRKWWGLDGYTNHITEIDLRPGGRWRFGQRGPDGSEVVFGGVYREIDPPNRFVYTKGWPDDTGSTEDSMITILFDEHDGRCTVTLLCEFSSRALRDTVAERGMERLQRSYDRMDTLLASLR